jgi:tRNA dimethylallyltransferase
MARGFPAIFAPGALMAAIRPILVVLGPTASGKTDVALSVARETDSEILSVDSMQVYRGMDVGTAKPSPADRATVRHHLLDVVGPDEPFTVARFVELADAAIADAGRRGVSLVATGGTPLYYKSLFEGLFEGPAADDATRARLRALAPEELYRRVSEADPAAAARIHPNDQKRLVRALEVHELTGRPISSFQTHWVDGRRRHPAVWVGLERDREALNRRINARVKAMLAAGWVDEVRRLLAAYGTLSHTAAEATGYRELIDHVSGRLPLDDAAERIKIATRQLARRQTKWFRRFRDVTWLRGDRPAVEIAAEALKLWRAGGVV